MDGDTDDYSPREHIVHNIIPSSVCESNSGLCGAIRYRNYKLVVGSEVSESTQCWSTWCVLLSAKHGDRFVSTQTIQCTEKGNYDFPIVDFENDCPYNGEPCLYDLDEDPCEYYDIKEAEIEIFDFMWDLLLEYNESAATALKLEFPDEDEAANPDNFGGFWSPWMSLKDDDDGDYDKMAVDIKAVDDIKVTEKGQDWDVSMMIICFVFVIIGLGVMRLWKLWGRKGDYKIIEDELAKDRTIKTVVC